MNNIRKRITQIIKALCITGVIYLIVFKTGLTSQPNNPFTFLKVCFLLGLLGLIFVNRIPSKRQKHSKRKTLLFESYEED